MDASRDEDERRRAVSEVGLGITVLGVIVNMGLTLGIGLPAPLVWRLVAAFGVPLVFIGLIALASRRLGLIRSITHTVTSVGDDPWGG